MSPQLRQPAVLVAGVAEKIESSEMRLSQYIVMMSTLILRRWFRMDKSTDWTRREDNCDGNLSRKLIITNTGDSSLPAQQKVFINERNISAVSHTFYADHHPLHPR